MVKKHAAKTSETSETINRLESGTQRSIVTIFTIALFGLSVATLNQLLINKMQPASTDIFALALISILATVVGLSYGFSILLTRRTRSTTALKKKVVEAYLQAPEQSSNIR